MIDRVALASDDHDDYLFYLPLTAWLWILRGREPIVFLVDREDSSARSRLVERLLREMDAIVVRLRCPSGIRTSTMAQVSRLYAAWFVDSGRIVTSDADMWPLSAWPGGLPLDEGTFQIYYANAHFGDAHLHFPMCYLDAEASTWREVMGGGGDFDRKMAEALLQCLGREPRPEEAGLVHRGVPLAEWNSDEWLFAERLKAWPGHPSRCLMVPRDMEKTGEMRLDRSAWKDVPSIAGFADAHLPRPGWDDGNWPHVRHLFSLASPSRVGWADDYHAEWTRTP